MAQITPVLPIHPFNNRELTMKQHLYRNPQLLVAAFLAFSGPASHAQAPAPVTAAAAAAAAPTPTPSQVKPDYPLGVGDAIRIQVFQNPDLTIETRVSENGSITYPLIGSVDIGGLSIAQAEKKIADALQKGGFIQKPQVTIALTQIRGNQVAVLGQVQRPGRFPLESTSTRLSDMLANAGGATPMGDDAT